MTVLPLSLIPTFAVPLFIILHIICVAQARLWTMRTYSQLTFSRLTASLRLYVPEVRIPLGELFRDAAQPRIDTQKHVILAEFNSGW